MISFSLYFKVIFPQSHLFKWNRWIIYISGKIQKVNSERTYISALKADIYIKIHQWQTLEKKKSKTILTKHLKIYTLCNDRNNDGPMWRHVNLWAVKCLLKYKDKIFFINLLNSVSYIFFFSFNPMKCILDLSCTHTSYKVYLMVM